MKPFDATMCALNLFAGPEVQQQNLVSGELMEALANKLGEHWKTLAPYLEIKASDMKVIESDSEDVKMRAKLLLIAWQDQEGARATTENLISALNLAHLNELAETLASDAENCTQI